MDTGTIVSLSISGAALAFSVFVFVDNLIHRKKYDDRLTVQEIAEKERRVEDEKKANIVLRHKPRDGARRPAIQVVNIGRHEATDIRTQFSPEMNFDNPKLSAFCPQLPPGEHYDLTYESFGHPRVEARITYTDGTGQHSILYPLQL